MRRLVQIHLDDSPPRAAERYLAILSRGCRRIELAGSELQLLGFAESGVWASLLRAATEHGWSPPAPADTVAWPAALRDAASPPQPGFGLCGGWLVERFAAGHLADPDEAVRLQARDHVVRLLELAGEWAVDRLTIAPAVVTAGNPQRVDYADALNRVDDAVALLARRAELVGVALAVRVAAHGFLMSPPEFREFLMRINSPAVGADVDLTQRSDDAAAQDWLDTLAAHLRTVGLEGHAVPDDLAPRLARTTARHIVLREYPPPCPSSQAGCCMA